MNRKTQKAFGVLATAATLLTVASAQTTTANNCATFGTNLRLGMRSEEVRKLQQVLNSNVATQVAPSGIGSAGQETNFFGPATFKAVIKFQELHAATALTPAGLTKGTGFVGSLTRSALQNASCGIITNNTNVTTPTNNIYNIAQPSGFVVTGQAAARLAEVVVTGNGTLTNLTLQRGGVSSNSALDNVYLYDGVARISDSASVNNSGIVTFNNLNVAVMGSKQLTVRADISSTATVGQAISMNLVSATINGAVAPQTFVGPTLSISSADTARVTANSANTALTNTSVNAPQTNYTVWGASVTVSTRAAVLKSFAVKMIGSAPTSAVTNVGLFVDGLKVASAYPDAMGRFTFTPNTTMNTGSHNIEVRADIVGGAYRNFYFSVENSADIVAEDSSLAGVASSVVNLNNVKNGGTMTINSASGTSVTLVTDPSFVTTNVVSGASNVTVGKFSLTAYGEDTKIQYLTVTLGALTSASNLTNVSLYVNGAQVGSNYTVNSSSTQEFSLGSSFVATAGVTYSVEVKADLTSSTGTQATGTVSATITNVKGQGVSSQNSLNGSTGIVTSPTVRSLTIGGGTPQVGKTVNGVSANTSANSSNVKIGSFSIQGGSVEDVTVRTLALSLGGTITLTNLNSVTLKDESGATLGTPAGVASLNQNYSVNMIVAKGVTKRVDVWANIGSASNGNTIIPTLTVTYMGNSSNLTTNVTAVTGDTVSVQSILVGTPTISSKVASRYVLGSSSQQAVVYNATSQYGSATINDMTFSVTGSGVQSVTVNGVTANVIGSTAIAYGVNLNVPAGSAGVNIPVTVNYTPAYAGSIASNSGVQSGATPTVTWTSAKVTDAAGAVNSALPVGSAANQMTVVASMPTVNAIANSGINVGVGQTNNVKLGTITVAADKAGDIVVNKIAYTAAGPGTVTVTSVKVNGSTANDKTGLAGTVANTDVTFTNGYRITAGSSVSFDIYGDVNNTGTTSGNTSISLGAPASFLWSDDASTNGANSTATPAANYTGTLLGANYNN